MIDTKIQATTTSILPTVESMIKNKLSASSSPHHTNISSSTIKTPFQNLMSIDEYPEWKSACAIHALLPTSPYRHLTTTDSNGHHTFRSDLSLSEN
eukprot:CAMPEP_0184868784 /NCGR_PEP_ID=MMETSP0580-20130426/31760_1 /TAXON_ID=1118495 /ORGANISM="Dactyliosolen fragilissimus" /LENGTH=95 /DNA_ID=CAMNT_0027369893 /DNA_START=553 /DNA_END=837 /DNA_ORIENTATION=+